MKNKPIKRSYISFDCNSSDEVTGSAYIVHHKEYQIMLDCGLIQGHGDIYTNYKANKDQCRKFRPKLIDVILITHSNIDHFGQLPYLYSKGCTATTYVPEGNKEVIKLLLEDSLKIMLSDCQKIERKHGKKASPLYGQDDIEKTMNHMVEVPINYTINIGPDISFEFLHAGHIRHSASIFLTLKRGSIIKRIYYSGDIGQEHPQLYTEPRQTPKRFNIGIVENTYNEPNRFNSIKDRPKDLEKVISVVNEYDRTIIPAFANNRGQVILTELYHLWQDGKIPHDIKVYYDSPLGQKISNIWEDEEWEKVYAWPNLYKVKDIQDSYRLQRTQDKAIVVASAGMCNAGRIVSWLKASIGNPKTHLLFIGYCPAEGIAADIKSNNREITIDGETTPNRCNYTELKSFSSHCSYYGMLDFYGSLEFDKLCLVHGESKNKVEFAHVLQDKLASQGKSSRVIAVSSASKIYI